MSPLKNKVAAKIAARTASRSVPVTPVAAPAPAGAPADPMAQMMEMCKQQSATIAALQAQLAAQAAAPNAKATKAPAIVFRRSAWAKSGGEVWELADANKDTDTYTHKVAAMDAKKWRVILEHVDLISNTLAAAAKK